MSSSLSPSTPSPTDRLSPASALRSGKRQAAFYPNTISKSPKPFSRSAAKRESVMALGSIEHLQYYFTKTGVSARQNPLKPTSNGVPALGPGVIRSSSPLQEEDEEEFVLPPTPLFPQPTSRIVSEPHVRTPEADPEHLKPGVIEDLEAVERAWDIRTGANDSSSATSTQHLDILSVLKISTRAIRSVRNYVVSLRDEFDFATPHVPHPEYRPSSFKPPTPTPRKASIPTPDDPVVRVRKAALEALSALRHMEERGRVPLSDEAYDIQSDSGSASTRSHTPGGTERVSSPFTTTSIEDDEDSTASFSFSVVKVPNRNESILVWSDDEDGYNKEDEKKDRWEERLVLAGGWLYKQDLTLADFERERTAIAHYLDGIDEILFTGKLQEQSYERGWRREKKLLEIQKIKDAKTRRRSGENKTFSPPQRTSRRVVSAGVAESMSNLSLFEEPEEMLYSVVEEEDEEGIPDEELPDWAKRGKFSDDPIARLTSLLVTLLPPDLLHLLPLLNDTSRTTLLNSLSSGQVLCNAYNIAVRRSKKPWGYINNAAVHDMAALENEATNDPDTDPDKKKVGWTFRRTDNLRLWMAALKLRYMIPLGPTLTPNTSRSISPAPSGTTQRPVNEFLIFDPQIVSKREPGWEDMLEKAVMKWMWCVVAEKRGTRV
ncbi:hypothetical protein Clacol_008519 [Clathrus columnatus]|uniref:Uncharacterized protein n=1 Tax=Clathrus columnatus TaxID=1419009 RepID=A0AAV5AN46_9AGAM|nr:hypothetical protein Clacol_008519 [Clathrus columnatus]